MRPPQAETRVEMLLARLTVFQILGLTLPSNSPASRVPSASILLPSLRNSSKAISYRLLRSKALRRNPAVPLGLSGLEASANSRQLVVTLGRLLLTISCRACLRTSSVVDANLNPSSGEL